MTHKAHLAVHTAKKAAISIIVLCHMNCCFALRGTQRMNELRFCRERPHDDDPIRHLFSLSLHL